jgi:hypothetical protein
VATSDLSVHGVFAVGLGAGRPFTGTGDCATSQNAFTVEAQLRYANGWSIAPLP